MLKEFKEFIMRGNVLDLAVAVIIGAAFGGIVTSMVNDVIMPPDRPGDGACRFQGSVSELNGQSYAKSGGGQDGGRARDRLRAVH